MPSIHYLAYGSNLHPGRIGARLDRCIALASVELRGWSLRFHKSSADGSGKCDLVADELSVAYGVVYEISSADKRRLDKIEGAGQGYHYARIGVSGFGEASVYLAEDSHIDGRLAPYDWYHAFVLSGAQHHHFPPAYIAELLNVDAVSDPDQVRRAQNRAILESVTRA